MKEYCDESFSEASFELSNVEFYDCNFLRLSLRERRIENVKFLECSFQNVDLSVFVGMNVIFRGCTFKNCKIIGCDFSSGISLNNCSFDECLLELSTFFGAKLMSSIFKYCSLKECDFREAYLKNSELTNSNFEGALLAGADLSECDLSNSINYFIDPSQTKITKSKFSMPEALTLLSAFDIKIS